MKKLYTLLTIILLCTTLQAQTVGLVLSGGGAKGIAHVGLIKALEENNIPIDYITGTSMGAIVGALYAMGYTPDEMMQLFNSREFLNWTLGIIPKEELSYFLLPEKTPEIITFNLGSKQDTTQNPTNLLKRILPESVISPLPMNLAFMDIFDSYTAQCQGNFDNLYVPFRAIATNVDKKREQIFASGNLGDAVRASMSIPIAFKPITIGGSLMFDGGIYDNFPVKPMEEEFHPDIMIGSILASNDTAQVPLSQQDVISQLLSFVMQENNYTIHPDKGIVVTCPVQDYTMFDFQDAQSIYEKGYEEGLAMIDSIKSRITREVTPENREISRRAFKSRTPKLRFDTISVDGVKESEKEYIIRQFYSGDTILSIDDVHRGFIRNISTQKIADLVPHAIYNDSTGLYHLQLTAKSKGGFSLGLGGFISSRNDNSIYLGGHYRTLSMNSMDLDVGLYLGQSYNAGMLSARIDVGRKTPMYLKTILVAQMQNYYENAKLFYTFKTPTFISNNENYIKFSLGLPVFSRAKAEITVGGGYLINRYYQSNQIDYGTEDKDQSQYLLLQTSAHIESNWLDNPMYPTKGGQFEATVSYIYGQERFNPAYNDNLAATERMHNYIQATASAHYYIPIESPFALGLRGEIAFNNNTFCENYTATMIQAPAFSPTPSTHNTFNTGLRANQYIAAGILPIWKITPSLQFRTEFYGFAPWRPIYDGDNNNPYYGKYFERINFLGEASIVYSLPFASVSLYANYCNAPKSQWNFGITLGMQLFAPKFLE